MYRNKADADAYRHKWNSGNKEHVLEYFRVYREKNRMKVKMWQDNFKEREKERLKKERHERYINNRERHAQYGVNNRQKLKRSVIDSLGGHCFCCGESDIGFLTVEHLLKDGAQHRREVKSRVYSDILQQGSPRGKYAVLCMNCNFATRFNKKCPHQKVLLELVA